MDGRGLVYLWRCDTGDVIETFSEPSSGRLRGGIAFNPMKPLLALLCQKKGEINVYDLEIDKVNNIGPKPDSSCSNYAAAKFLLVGDSGIGESVDGTDVKQIRNDRHIFSIDNRKVLLEGKSMESREIILWDITCQPDHKDTFPLQMNDLSGMLVLLNILNKPVGFDGLRSWNKALEQVQLMYGNSSSALKKVLIVINPEPKEASKESREEIIKSIEWMVKELGFVNYFITSNKEWKNIKGLSDTLHEMVEWKSIQKVHSLEFLNSVKEFIDKQKDSGQLSSNTDVLFEAFVNTNKSLTEAVDTRSWFNTCIRYIELTGYLRQLNSGRVILFIPELFNTYAFAMINEARNEPTGLGVILESDASAGEFKIPEETRIKDTGQEKLFLSAVIEELLFIKTAMRVTTSRGRFLVFPLQITRKDQDMGEPVGKSDIIQFKGSVINIFAALTAAISLSVPFKKKVIWNNAAVFVAANGATCGILLSKIQVDCGEIVLFFSSKISNEASRQFKELINTNLMTLALPDSTIYQHIVSCPHCGKVTIVKAADKQPESGRVTAINCSMCNTPIKYPGANKPTKPLLSTRQSTAINLDFLRTADRIAQSTLKIAKTTSAKPASARKPLVESKTAFTPPKT